MVMHKQINIQHRITEKELHGKFYISLSLRHIILGFGAKHSETQKLL
jgi:hypothetical protein